MYSSRRCWRPTSVRLYSYATTLSATPQRLRIRAATTPVRSLPAEQWTRMGFGASSEARWESMALKGGDGWLGLAAELRMPPYALTKPLRVHEDVRVP